MRDIKFRAWNKNKKEWAYLFVDTGHVSSVMHRDGEHEHWQQSTSLHDKHGKEIWEGDFLRYHNPATNFTSLHFVLWQEKKARFGLVIIQGSQVGNIRPFTNKSAEFDNKNFEVVGNVFANR